MGWALILLSILPRDQTVRERCEHLELNHIYTEWGDKHFDQLIFWRDSPYYDGLHVRNWAKLDNCRLTWQNGRPVAWTWKNENLYRIEADDYQETWTQFDRELEDRAVMPEQYRVPLRGWNR